MESRSWDLAELSDFSRRAVQDNGLLTAHVLVLWCRERVPLPVFLDEAVALDQLVEDVEFELCVAAEHFRNVISKGCMEGPVMGDAEDEARRLAEGAGCSRGRLASRGPCANCLRRAWAICSGVSAQLCAGCCGSLRRYGSANPLRRESTALVAAFQRDVR